MIYPKKEKKELSLLRHRLFSVRHEKVFVNSLPFPPTTVNILIHCRPPTHSIEIVLLVLLSSLSLIFIVARQTDRPSDNKWKWIGISPEVERFCCWTRGKWDTTSKITSTSSPPWVAPEDYGQTTVLHCSLTKGGDPVLVFFPIWLFVIFMRPNW